MSRFKTEKDILKIVESFENATVTRENWRHAEHLTVALYYVTHHDAEMALTKMRGGIFNLLKAFGVDLSKEMPYHETLTVFWIRQIDDYAKSKNGLSIVEIANEMIEKFDKDHPLKFYSREFLFSDEARKEFIFSALKNFK